MAIFSRNTLFLLVVLAVACFLSEALGKLHCRCSPSDQCPDFVKNKTCITEGVCYRIIELADGVEYHTSGCLPADEKNVMQCRTKNEKHYDRKTMLCCNKKNFCNVDLQPTLPPPTTAATVSEEEATQSYPKRQYIILFTTAGVCGAVFIVVMAIIYVRFKQLRDRPMYEEKYRDIQYLSTGETLKDLMDQSSGSGSGLPLLVQQTIAKQVTLLQSVGKGRYGEVWRASWRGESVAVKIFLSHSETSWMREKEIYETVLLRHESILGFIAADIIGSGQVIRMYLITDYHPRGSLYDFLRGHELDKKGMVKLSFSAAAGLSHLHSEITGTKGKVPIAHRDIKSKNILVKENFTCCIADFGLAVKYVPETEEVDIKGNTRIGTKRYMAPELLDFSNDHRNFSSFKMSDIYSFGLVLWEISRRCISEETGKCEDYQIPYFDLLPGDPSLEDVRKVVVTERKRPLIPNRWYRDESLQTMSKLITECWASHPAARLTALRVKKSLNKVSATLNPQVTSEDLQENIPLTMSSCV